MQNSTSHPFSSSYMECKFLKEIFPLALNGWICPMRLITSEYGICKTKVSTGVWSWEMLYRWCSSAWLSMRNQVCWKMVSLQQEGIVITQKSMETICLSLLMLYTRTDPVLILGGRGNL
ncbi:uncharacterized protein LOC114580300 isoform X4 [Dendrobium catenatum]|uniref:uncharacterized protein LOC114580300 isoform X4 n=1 Tax=Dendrobium catenatum TaxID=906689 RepID=UPI0010A0AEDE|nr:uncharacterized protein LOC114580300 isoform X4 [Dendrobium catenatum]